MSGGIGGGGGGMALAGVIRLAASWRQ